MAIATSTVGEIFVVWVFLAAGTWFWVVPRLRTSTGGAVTEVIPTIDLSPNHVEMIRDPQKNWKLKLTVYWSNEGDALHLGPPSWIPRGLVIQGNTLFHRYQLWENGKWGADQTEIDVLPGQQYRMFLGMDPSDPDDVIEGLRAVTAMGILILPVAVKGVQLSVRLRF